MALLPAAMGQTRWLWPEAEERVIDLDVHTSRVCEVLRLVWVRRGHPAQAVRERLGSRSR